MAYNFLYSSDQIKEKNEILNKTGKVFNPGTVVVNGMRKKFTQLSKQQSIPRFVDTVVVAECNNLDDITYTLPQISRKESN